MSARLEYRPSPGLNLRERQATAVANPMDKGARGVDGKKNETIVPRWHGTTPCSPPYRDERTLAKQCQRLNASPMVTETPIEDLTVASETAVEAARGRKARNCQYGAARIAARSRNNDPSVRIEHERRRGEQRRDLRNAVASEPRIDVAVGAVTRDLGTGRRNDAAIALYGESSDEGEQVTDHETLLAKLGIEPAVREVASEKPAAR
jgi:hypothetical protein